MANVIGRRWAAGRLAARALAWDCLVAGAVSAMLTTVAMAQASRDLAARPPSPYDRDALYPTPVVMYGLLNSGWLRTGEVPGSGRDGIGATERSRLGLRATEILDGGLQAHMNLEQSILLANGSLRMPGKSFDARASVGLGERELGRIDVGRMEQAASALVVRADPWGGGGVVGPGERLYAVNPEASTRSSAMLAYSSRADRPIRLVLQVNRPSEADNESPGHGASLAWDWRPWLVGVGLQRTDDGARNVPLVIGHDDGTRNIALALTDGRSRHVATPDLLRYRNLFVGMSVRGFAKGDPDRHEWRAGLNLHRVEGDVDGRLGSGAKFGFGWRYKLSRHTWTNLGAARIHPRQGADRWAFEASLSYSFARDLRVPQGFR